MNPKYDKRGYKKFPNITKKTMEKSIIYFIYCIDIKNKRFKLIDFVNKIMEYSAKKRISAAQALKN